MIPPNVLLLINACFTTVFKANGEDSVPWLWRSPWRGTTQISWRVRGCKEVTNLLDIARIPFLNAIFMHSFSEGRNLNVTHNWWFITDYLYWKLNNCFANALVIRGFKFSVYWKEVIAFFVVGMYLLLRQHELKVGSDLPYTSFSWLGIIKRRPSILMEGCNVAEWLGWNLQSALTNSWICPWFNSLAALVCIANWSASC